MSLSAVIDPHVQQKRSENTTAAAQNVPFVQPHIAAHLRIQARVLATIVEAHEAIVDTNEKLDPVEKSRAAAVWPRLGGASRSRAA